MVHPAVTHILVGVLFIIGYKFITDTNNEARRVADRPSEPSSIDSDDDTPAPTAQDLRTLQLKCNVLEEEVQRLETELQKLRSQKDNEAYAILFLVTLLAYLLLPLKWFVIGMLLFWGFVWNETAKRTG
ncbi:hypothetical protein BJ508DRAFT_371464 [Ascobolus immersus RN42]|uniref:Uncharacterized protein n=1 Tax=Ascobolus immersus RN42 TaxID=1160509 RepID=A0A3N4J264_ASCIM|nr:hypothetical protein BJ508DRAFT_371464 [Ascobolus immersus RN42]